MSISQLNIQALSIINYLLIVLLGIVVAFITWKIVSFSDDSMTINSINVATKSVDKEKEDTKYQLDTIISSNLFGTAQNEGKRNVKISVPVKDLKNTKLDLQLTGLIKGENSVAVIIYQNRQNAYIPGDFIVNKSNLKVRLLSIENNYVIIENNDNQERLSLPKQRSSSATSLGIGKNDTSIGSVKNLNLDLNSEQMKSLLGENPKKIITTNPLSLSKFIQINPKLDNGKLSGYKVSPGPDQRLLNLSGIKAGDIITHVEGQAAANLTIANMYKTLQLKESINVTVERNGSIVTMDIKL